MTNLATTYRQLIILNWILSTIIIALICLIIDQYPLDLQPLLWPIYFNIKHAFFLQALRMQLAHNPLFTVE